MILFTFKNDANEEVYEMDFGPCGDLIRRFSDRM